MQFSFMLLYVVCDQVYKHANINDEIVVNNIKNKKTASTVDMTFI